MYFQHANAIWADYPELAAGVMLVEGVDSQANVDSRLQPRYDTARSRLENTTEGALPEIQAWRRAFSRMGLKPTQYRCAAESLLRRFRREDTLPRIHPLIDLCNAASIAFAIPVAVFDVAEIAGFLEVRYASGGELYQTFSGELEHPNAGEVIFADGENRAHARRWTNRQSGYSAVKESTTTALIVAEAMHPNAREDVEKLVEAVTQDLAATWALNPTTALLSAMSPRVEF